MALDQGAGHSFSEIGIAASAPKKSGVYVIYNRTTWIYVGEAGDIEVRLYSHLRGESDPKRMHFESKSYRLRL